MIPTHLRSATCKVVTQFVAAIAAIVLEIEAETNPAVISQMRLEIVEKKLPFLPAPKVGGLVAVAPADLDGFLVKQPPAAILTGLENAGFERPLKS